MKQNKKLVSGIFRFDLITSGLVSGVQSGLLQSLKQHKQLVSGIFRFDLVSSCLVSGVESGFQVFELFVYAEEDNFSFSIFNIRHKIS